LLLGGLTAGCLSDRAPHDRRKEVVLPDLGTQQPPKAERKPLTKPRPSSTLGPLRGYVSADWVQTRLESKGLRILDLRPVTGYRLGHLPGSISDPGGLALLGVRPPDAKAGAPDYTASFQGATVVLVHSDRSARDLAVAARAYLLLHSTGIARRIAVLRGGYTAWKQQRRPLATEARPVHRAKAAVRAAKPAGRPTKRAGPRILRDAASLSALRRSVQVVMVDARPGRSSKDLATRPGGVRLRTGRPRFDIAALYAGSVPGVGPARRVLRRLLKPLLAHRKSLRLVPYSPRGLWASLLWFSLRSELNLSDVFDAVYFGVPPER